jgi:hypothetical protein
VTTSPEESRKSDSRQAPELMLPRQRLLLRVLIEKDAAVANMYHGAIMARHSEGNPDHISQACHSMRELIDNVPKYFAIPVEPAGRLRDQVDALQARWVREPRVRNSSDAPLSATFIAKLVAFFQWVDEHLPKRIEAARTTIRGMDVSGRQLPATIEQMRAEEWMKIRDFFVAGTHHGTCSTGEFDAWLEVFEDFILSFTKPRTFETAAQIDALIAEGESGG